MLRFRPWSAARSPDPAEDPTGVEDAWCALSLLIELIKHAETKAAATLAAACVLGGLLYSLIGRTGAVSLAAGVTAVVAATAIVVAGLESAIALRPRARSADRLPGLLFYRDIARRFPDPEHYARELTRLLVRRGSLRAALAHQVWHNAEVAARKYRAINVAVTALIVALSATAVTAVLVVLAA